MLEGIAILGQGQIFELPAWYMILTILLFLIGITGGFISLYEEKKLCCIICTIMFIVSIFFICLPEKFQTPTGRYEYKVMINNDVPFVELYSKYEIIDQEGLIWTIRDKEQKK